MQGRKEFTRAELDEITRILSLKQGASASRQKQLRRELRDLGFYISDFDSVARTFGSDDLARLVRQHRIIVSDEASDRPEVWWKRLLRMVGIRLD